MERLVLTQLLYPALLAPLPSLNFSDQYAFRPTGSTTAAHISLLHTVTDLLLNNPYVAVIALDVSKAFDTARHATLLDKIVRLHIPDNVYNWLVDYFDGPSPPLDNIQVMVIVLRGNIIRTALCWIV